MTATMTPQGPVSVPSMPPPPAGITVRPAKIPAQVHVAILIDATGSSATFAQGIGRTSELILRGVESKAAKVCCSVQIHRDEDYGQMPRPAEWGSVAEALNEISPLISAAAATPRNARFRRLLRSTPWAGCQSSHRT